MKLIIAAAGKAFQERVMRNSVLSSYGKRE